jgi:ABC-type branched-subunit amino acid transport system ATPase component
MSILLELERINSNYGDSHILFDLSLHVERNEVVALLGRNGAGKSTTSKSLIGLVGPHRARRNANAKAAASCHCVPRAATGARGATHFR